MRGLHAARAMILAGAIGLSCGLAWAGQLMGSSVPGRDIEQSANLVSFGTARLPSGLADFCSRQPEQCQPVKEQAQTLQLTHERWELLSTVNGEVNQRVASTTDEKLYGRLEYWTLPATAGDCEDYVLLKRQILAERGIPLSSLLITVVQDENGEGHAVLTVPTTLGDLVLDNRRDQILNWRETGYKFVKRQSPQSVTAWVALGREKLQATVIASGPEASPAQ